MRPFFLACTALALSAALAPAAQAASGAVCVYKDPNYAGTPLCFSADKPTMDKLFAEDIAKGVIENGLDVTDVWPENYSANSVQKVWAAKFAARHPNVVVLDLSSFKCGHDAPTYGLIDSIISASATPYSALHDIDANKPGGSIKIRVKTYAHSLKLHEERLDDIAKKKEELKYRIEEKRLQLLEAKRQQLAARKSQDPELEKMIVETKAKVAEYMAKVAARKQPVDVVQQAKEAGLVRLGIKKSNGNGDEVIARV